MPDPLPALSLSLLLLGSSCASVMTLGPAEGLTSGQVTIEYIAHACFRIQSAAGTRVLIDPYASRVWLGYDFPKGIDADAILVTHPHFDHDGGEFMGRTVPWPAGGIPTD